MMMPACVRRLQRLLKSVGLHSELFATPQEFLRHKLPDGPSCLVLDVRLPGMSGLEVQSKLIETESNPHHFHHRTWRHSHDGQSDEVWSSGISDETFPRSGSLDAIQQALQRDSEARQQQHEIAELKERYAKLTAREREVMRLIVSGMLTKQIASTTWHERNHRDRSIAGK